MRKSGIVFTPVAQGLTAADGTEQTVLEILQQGQYSGYIDLTELEPGDTLRVKEYIFINGSYKRYKTQDYSGPQSDPVLYIQPKSVSQGVMVSIQQIARIHRSFYVLFSVENLRV